MAPATLVDLRHLLAHPAKYVRSGPFWGKCRPCQAFHRPCAALSKSCATFSQSFVTVNVVTKFQIFFPALYPSILKGTLKEFINKLNEMNEWMNPSCKALKPSKEAARDLDKAISNLKNGINSLGNEAWHGQQLLCKGPGQAGLSHSGRMKKLVWQRADWQRVKGSVPPGWGFLGQLELSGGRRLLCTVPLELPWHLAVTEYYVALLG